MNMVSSNSSQDARAGNIDAYALFEALTGRKIDRRSMSSTTLEEYDDLRDLRRDDNDNDDDERRRRREGNLPRPDERPKDVQIGAINPYALVEAMIGRRLDRRSMNAARIMSDVLQTDYDELFDMKHHSVLFAGLRLDERNRMAEHLNEKDVRILKERDLETPDLSRVNRLEDLERIGLRDLNNAKVKMARMQNGKLRLVVNAQELGRTVSNKDVTMTLNELALPYRRNEKDQDRNRWNPPNADWRDLFEVIQENGTQTRLINNMENFRLGRGCNYENKFDDPIQGASSNSWLIAAIFSVFWADPGMINRNTRMGSGMNNGRHSNNGGNNQNERRRTLSIRFHDKGGRNNSQTATVEVNYDIPVNNSSNDPVYCRSSDGTEIWPALYEKAFAKWITGNHGEHPDITQTHHGDPVKAMAQINNREPQYYFCDNHSAHDLVGLVRNSSVNYKTINPMAAWTHATDQRSRRRDDDNDSDDDNDDDRKQPRRRDDNDDDNKGGNGDDDERRRRRRRSRERRNRDMGCDIYRGSNLVANHAYSVLGWAGHGDRQYIVLRNPWGVTEPLGLTSYPGLIDRVEPEFWRPACLLDQEGVLAIEANAFREYFQYIGVAK